MLEYWSGRSTLTYTRTYTLNVCIAESANRARKLKYDILSFRMPIARKFTRSAVLRIDADASKSRLRLCNSMSIRAYHPFLPPRCDARCCQRGSRVARARGWTPHRGIVPSPFKIPVSGESMRFDATSPGGMESPVCEQPRPNFSLLRERGMKLIPIEVYRAKFSTVCVSRSSII